MDRYVVYDRNDGHIIDTARTAAELRDRSWWRGPEAGIASRSWYERFGPQKIA